MDKTIAQSVIGERYKCYQMKVRRITKSKGAKEWMTFEEITNVAKALLRDYEELMLNDADESQDGRENRGREISD